MDENTNKPTLKRYGVIHAVASCQQCDWTAEYYITAMRLARAHTEETGHTTDIETGSAFSYEVPS